MIKTILLSLLALLTLALAVILGVAATKPDSFRVQRSIGIDAPAEKIYAVINDFRQWPAWSPYEKLDPAMTRTLSGPATGVGSVYEWSGNDKAGAGRMEIVDSSPAAGVALKLDFSRPFEAHNRVDFKLQPQGNATKVTWDMHGPAPFVSKLMQVFFSMDTMVGRDFETGLANLKSLVEK